MMNNEIFELNENVKRLADSMESLSNFFKAYGRLMDGMGLTDKETVDFVKKSITKAIEEQKELEAQEAEEAEAKDAGKKSRFELECENEYLYLTIKRLEEELESVYADSYDKED